MPLYSYVCKQCEHAFDVQQSFTDAALTECPECGGELRKVFGKVGVTFKGSGFYRNDSGSTSKKSD
jgi:putative FmdB family regulatory protein